jgi:DNA-binding transcriptional MocR family regulator
MISEVYHDFQPQEAMDFSLSAPAQELLPTAKLNKAMHHALRHAPGHGIHYENSRGCEPFRKQLARLALSWGGAVSEDEVIVTAGCMEALVLCMQAVTRPGDAVAIECPTYFGIFQAIEHLGLKVVEIPTDPSTGIELEALEKALQRGLIRACVLTPTFNNPLGSCMPDERKRDLVELLAQYETPLVEDDIYGELYFGRQRPRAAKYYDQEGIVLYCSSLSKSLAPGYRLGWTIPGRWKQRVAQLKLAHNVSSNALAQYAAAHFLEVGRYELHLRRLRQALHTQCLRYLQAIQQYFPPGTRVSRPGGGFVLWVELPPGIDAYQLYRRARRRHIAIAPGQLFSTQGKFSNFVRIGYGRPWSEKVENGLRQLGAIVAEMINN